MFYNHYKYMICEIFFFTSCSNLCRASLGKCVLLVRAWEDELLELGRADRAGFLTSLGAELILRSKWTRFSDLELLWLDSLAWLESTFLGSTDCSRFLNRARVWSSSVTCLLTCKSKIFVITFSILMGYNRYWRLLDFSIRCFLNVILRDWSSELSLIVRN